VFNSKYPLSSAIQDPSHLVHIIVLRVGAERWHDSGTDAWDYVV